MKRKSNPWTAWLLLLVLLINVLITSSMVTASEMPSSEDVSKLNTELSVPVETAHVGVMTGSIGEIFITQNYPNAKVSSFDSFSDAAVALEAGKLDYVIGDYTTMSNHAKVNKNLELVPGSLSDDANAIAFKKGNIELRDQFDLILNKLKADGTLADMERRWFKTEDSPYELAKVPVRETDKILRVAISADLEPNCFVQDGQYVGFDCELAERIAYELGMKVEYQNMKFGGLISALQAGKADVIISGLTYTEERAQSVEFSQTYFDNPQVFLTRKKTENIKAPSQQPVLVENARVGVMTGSTGEIFITQQYPSAKISSFDTFPDAVAALDAGKLDYVIGSYTTMANYAKVNKNLELVPGALSDDASAIGFKKGNTELRDKIDLVLDKLKADGTLADMERRWIKTDNSPYELATIPVRETDKILRVAISADREPICFVQDGKYVGLDCELIERIAYELGMKVEYQNMKFGGLISSLQAGKVDMAISNLTYTEERAQSIEFSQTYFANPQTLLTHKGTENINVPWYQSFAESFKKTFITENRYQLILQGLGITLIISICSAAFGTLLGFVICLMRRAKTSWLCIPAKIFVGFIQGTPVVVMLMILFYVIFGNVDLSPVLVAIIGFSINFAAYVSEMMRTGIDAVDKGQLEAASAIGFNKIQTFYKITMPQALRHILPVFKGEFISTIKMTSVVGYIAIQDLTKMSDIIRSRTYEAFFPLISIALIYLAISYLVVLLIARLEFKVNPKHRKREVKGVIIK